MATASSIEWTDCTWSPVTGCTRHSPGCDNCYSARMTHRLEAMGQAKYAGLTVLNPKGDRHFNGVVKCHPDELATPFRWRKPRRIFVCSMSDLFHRDVPFDFIDRVFAVAALCPQHTFQILTKRPERMAEWCEGRHTRAFGTWDDAADHFGVPRPDRSPLAVAPVSCALLPYLPNVWLGTSVEDQKRADERIPHLLRCPAAVHFLSCEPMLGPVDLHDAFYRARLGTQDTYKRRMTIGIDWVIVGGESGPGARPCDTSWVRRVVRECKAASVPAFVKQMGSRPVSTLGGQPDTPDGTKAFPMRLKDSKGGDPSEWPEDLRVREFPAGVRS